MERRSFLSVLVSVTSSMLAGAMPRKVKPRETQVREGYQGLDLAMSGGPAAPASQHGPHGHATESDKLLAAWIQIFGDPRNSEVAHRIAIVTASLAAQFDDETTPRS